MLHPSAHVADRADRCAVVMGGSGAHEGRTLTYRELEDGSNRVARLLRRHGFSVGDHVAVLLPNRPEWYPITWGALRSGLYVTPVNWHLAAAEAAYIVADSGARALVTDARFADLLAAMGADLAAVDVRLVLDGDVPGFDRFEEAVAAESTEPIPDQSEGAWMLYSSGTTGRPKGIKPPAVGRPLGEAMPFASLLMHHFGFEPDMVYLSPAPLYHASPAGWTAMTQRFGGTVVAIEQFDPVSFLRLIEEHRVTHTQVVPTHLVRLLELPEEERRRYDLSSLRTLVHSAAPCPPAVKQATIEWLGPIVSEMYGGSEGVGLCIIGADEWLAHPGSVGRSLTGEIHVVDDDGREVGPGEIGQVWFANPHAFAYHNDPEKTAASFRPEGWSTLGDIGHVDADGYLYLSDRVGNTIISGGVNIYPRAVEDLLIGHPAVHDVAVVGRPDPDMGERVVAFVQVAPDYDALGGGDGSGLDDLPAELIAYSRAHLSHFTCPREVHLVDSLPRLPTGKLLKRLLPEPA